MGDTRLSGISASYYPPSLQPGFMGAHPPSSSGRIQENGNLSYFQNYRNESISRMQMPPYEWGLMNTPYTPRPDIAVFGKSTGDKFLQVPPSNISMLDVVRQQEVDDFYKLCQMHRDQYKDHTGALHPFDYFKKDDYTYQCPEDPTSKYMRYPEYYVEYKKPQVLPLTLERSYRSPNLPHRALTGVYSPTSDIAYKR